jgi:hypothetical protein
MSQNQCSLTIKDMAANYYPDARINQITVKGQPLKQFIQPLLEQVTRACLRMMLEDCAGAKAEFMIHEYGQERVYPSRFVAMYRDGYDAVCQLRRPASGLEQRVDLAKKYCQERDESICRM